MSNIGKNIKKIRSVKKLTQTQFADIFDLKRTSVGAYEEGRAEPKSDVMIEIAKYFNISIDSLLTKELTVNDLYKFDIFREELTGKDIGHNVPKSIVDGHTVEMGFVDQDLKNLYISNYNKKEFLTSLPTVKLPFKINITTRAFAYIDNNQSKNLLNMFNNDIVVCTSVGGDNWNTIQANHLYQIITKQQFITQVIVKTDDDSLHLDLNSDNKADSIVLKADILEVWKVVGYYSMNVNESRLNNVKLLSLEQKIDQLLHKL